MKSILISIFIFVGTTLLAQSGNMVFNDSIVHSLSIESNLINWIDSLDADYRANANTLGHPQRYFKCKVTFDGVVLNDCGFKEKGNASNWFTSFGKKKPLKISFDEFNSSQTLNGLKKININNFTNDPSLLHDVICFKVMRDVITVAPRTAYTKVWVDGEYIGLYLIIENVDKTFLKDHYGSANNDGNLYKTDRNCQMFMKWLGDAKQAYKDKNFTLNTNETVDDWSKFIDLVNLLNNNYDADFKQQLESKFDVHDFLKILAIEKCCKSWDSYWGGGNNFFIYEHPDGKIRWIPWDMNETFQEIKAISGTSILSGYLIPTPQLDERPLIKRIFEYDDWKAEYLNNVCDLIHSKFTLDNLGKYILDRHTLVDSAYKADVYKYNSYEAYKISLTERNEDIVSVGKLGNGFHVRYPGIFPVIVDQRKWAVEQMKGWDVSCSIENKTVYNLSVFPNPATDVINITNDFSAFEFAEFKLYDASGKLCRNSGYQLMYGNYYPLQLTAVPAGIYFLLKTSVDGKVGKAKIIIQ